MKTWLLLSRDDTALLVIWSAVLRVLLGIIKLPLPGKMGNGRAASPLCSVPFGKPGNAPEERREQPTSGTGGGW